MAPLTFWVGLLPELTSLETSLQTTLVTFLVAMTVYLMAAIPSVRIYSSVQGRRLGILAGVCSKLVTITPAVRKQRVMNASAHLTFSFYLIQPPVHGIVPPIFMVDLPTSTPSRESQRDKCLEICLLYGSTSW